MNLDLENSLDVPKIHSIVLDSGSGSEGKSHKSKTPKSNSKGGKIS